MISRTLAVRAIVKFHIICACPLIVSSCETGQLGSSTVGGADPGAGGAQGGARAGNGGSAPAAGDASAATGGATTAAGGASMGGASGATGPGGAGGVAGTGGASNGGSSGGNADAGTRGDADADTKQDGSTPNAVGPFAYGISIAPNGSWLGIEDPAAEVAALAASGAKYIRFSRAMSLTAVGIPDSTNAPYARQLIQAGLSLGAVLIAQSGASVSDLVDMGNTLKNSGFYDWIFVDGALTRTDIQQVIDGLAAVGWTKIMVNDTLFGTPNAVTNPPNGVWAHSKAFGAVNNPTGPAVTPGDIAFIQYIHQHFPDSIAVLKLEIDSGVEKFLALPTATQNLLLTEWTQAQSVYGYTMIYPLFTTTYDSKTAGTYDTQVMLMK